MANPAKLALPLWLPVVTSWVIVVAIVVGLTLNGADRPLLADTDDAMRLVTVEDFIAGQGWWDHSQDRLNVPYGSEMHWSRLIDVPIAGLIILFRSAGADSAVTFAAFAWPLLLLLVLLLLSAGVTARLAGPDSMLPAVALPVLTPAVMAEFLPGRFDHHGVQIIVTMVAIFCAIEALRRPRWAIAAGIAAATGLAVGAESVPTVAAAILAFGVVWVLEPRHALALRMFGVSFGAGTALHLAIAWPPERWLEPSCDTMSVVYAGSALGAGTVLALLSYLPLENRSVLVRLAAGIVAGAATLAAVIVVFPHCLAGPTAALDPWLIEVWVSNIIESRPILLSFAELPDLVVATVLPLVLAVAVVAYNLISSHEARERWLVYALFLGVTIVVTLVMVRGARLSGMVAIPAGAWLIATARSRYIASKSITSIGALLASWLAFAGLIVMAGVSALTLALAPTAATEDAATVGGRSACLMPESFEDLAALAPQRVMAPIDLGAHILAFTHHSVVAAPYPRNFQRNAEGIVDGFRFFNEPIESARAILSERGVTLVVDCPTMVEMQTNNTTALDSFAILSRQALLPQWLHEVSTPGAVLKLYEVRSGS